MKDIFYTKEGYDKLKRDYQKLLEKRKEAVKTLAAARDLGDLSENGLYRAARARLSSIDHNLRRLDHLIKKATVVNNQNNSTIQIGSKVILRDEIENEKNFQIVGEYETDPMKGKISNNSPLGKILMGKKRGDVVTVNAPSGRINYKIVKIS